MNNQKNFEKEKLTDFWGEFTAQQQIEIKMATSEIENGDFTDYDSFMENHR
ncbi:hypothetical protein IMCC3317_32350 [Kordia antarctica]|uniref:Uncharacterized protein n=1 Tax=Kordia antarctica TaxID=1218801 RepID=A0A7L4ZMH6_9FLAO|nr:hypothetical protein [Kordia antarctica]QHI37852.1 hypothetical protein IMCC3317_32350 [Kordia antarctica]